MKAYILKNLRRRYKEGRDKKKEIMPMLGKGRRTLSKGGHINITVNINNFEKPVGAVIQTGGKQDINEIVEIKKE